MHDAPVFIIDDDIEDLEITQEIWPELKFNHPLELFSKPEDLIRRLREKINPFLIICDVNLRKMDGFVLRQRLSEETALSYKSIPFVFWSTSASDDQIKKGYDTGGHGFFIKGRNYAEIKESLRIIMEYWTESKAPHLPETVREAESGNLPIPSNNRIS